MIERFAAFGGTVKWTIASFMNRYALLAMSPILANIVIV